MNDAAIRRLARLDLAIVLMLCSCGDSKEIPSKDRADRPDARIVAIGDSVMWWNADEGASIADAIAGELDETVANLAVPGAAISHPNPAMAIEGLDIRAQYRDHTWQWVVLTGGANDLGDEGAIHGCATVLEELISEDGRSGELPDLVRRIRSSGARVIALGYYELPAVEDAEDFCGDALTTLSKRIETMAALDAGVHFVSMADIMSPDDGSAYDLDRVHPSTRSSRVIGQRVAAVIRETERR